MGPCHRIHLRHANRARLDNNFSDYSSEDSFLKQCHTYCFQVPSSSSLTLIWACAQKRVLYMFSIALAVTWGVLSTNKNNVKFSWKCYSCSGRPDEGSLVAIPQCRLHSLADHLSLWMFISPAFLFDITNPSVSEPVFACTSTFLFDILLSEWLHSMANSVGFSVDRVAEEVLKIVYILWNWPTIWNVYF